MLELCIFSGSFLATYFGVAWFRRWTVKRGVIDLPNERSSHSAPTPRGGGLVIAIVVIAAYICASFLLPFEISWGFVTGASLIVIVSWLDDVYSLSFIWRLLVHSLAAILVIWSNGYIASFPLPNSEGTLEMGRFGAVVTFCWIVWLINAYNFMDGIDGIAGVQALSAGVGWLIVGGNLGLPAIYVLAGTVMFASGAFLLHNWPPARIFLGDSGSAFLGYIFAVIPLLAKNENGINPGYYLIAGILFVWLFVFDSVLTLIRRIFRGEQVWQAHREHLYQRLVASGYSHQRTTMIYGLTSVVISISTAFSLTSSRAVPTYAVGIIVVSESGLLLLFCWSRKCLIGQVS